MVSSNDRSAEGAGDVVIGVLALQGGFAAHTGVFRRLGFAAEEIRRPEALRNLDGLVLPGGESTTLLKLMEYEPRWWESFAEFHARGGAILGTCAGLILLAREVRSPAQSSLGLLNAVVARNSYGRQRESFESRAEWSDGRPLDVVFIRAPRILDVGEEVEVLATHRGEPVLIAEGAVLGATFHPELGSDPSVHELFLERASFARRALAS